MARYHINPKGEPGKCSVITGTCPYGAYEDHFSSVEEARAAFESGQIQVPTIVKKAHSGPTYPNLYAFVESSDYNLDPKTSRVGDSVFTESGRLYRISHIDRFDKLSGIRVIELNPETGEPKSHVSRLLSHYGDNFATAKIVANYRVGEEKTEAVLRDKIAGQIREEEKLYLERDRAENTVNGIALQAPEAFEALEELPKRASRAERNAHFEEDQRRRDIQTRYFIELGRIQKLDRAIALVAQQRENYEKEIAKIHEANKRELRILTFPKPNESRGASSAPTHKRPRLRPGQDPDGRLVPDLAPGVAVRKRRGVAEGKILNVVAGGYEVKWENNAISYHSARELEAV